MAIAPTVPGSSNPQDEYDGYTIDYELVEEMFEAAGNGDTIQALTLCNRLGLGWMSHEIERLSIAAKKYTILETSADSLGIALERHQVDGVVPINAEQKQFLETAIAEMAKDGKPMPPGVYFVYKKIMNGESITVLEAKNLYQWTLEAKEVVIPSEFRVKAIEAQLQQLRDQWDKKLPAFAQDLNRITPRN